MEAKFSQRVKDVLIYSREEAQRLGNDYIGLEHLLLGIIREGEGLAIRILRNLGVDLSEIKKKVDLKKNFLVTTLSQSTPAGKRPWLPFEGRGEPLILLYDRPVGID